MQTIHRLIRHRETLDYLGRSGWTRDIAQAQLFEDVIEAAKACIQHDLRDVDLVLQPGNAGTDLFRTSMR